ncbi:MAG: N-acetyl-alpha-D-glucosaminyl L-malate synthase BshA [Cyanobacteria bacterium REEB67]|nr:N-acetyl-alpha-D-glucosaminyl L-malate synthase BshA [Cyanobacteria bacterium REEB67]
MNNIMHLERPLNIGITCYPSIGGSGVIATTLGIELAKRGHDVHFISYERPFRLPADAERIHFHPVSINDYNLFKYPDYTLPLSVKMAEVSCRHQLDILHVHYAVPHATAAILARCMLAPGQQPKVVTTLHGTDTTLLGRDPGYGPAIFHALSQSDAVTTVSKYLLEETQTVLGFHKPMQVITNFFEPNPPARSRQETRLELGIADDQVMLLHSSNLRPTKRIDLLLETVARISPRRSFKLVILAGASFAPFLEDVRRLGLEDRLVVRENILEIEEYLQAADIDLITSENESFCLSILEAMFFGCPSVATRVGGIPEVVEDGVSGYLVPFGDANGLARAVEKLIQDPDLRRRLGENARRQAQEKFSAAGVIPQYEHLYQSLVEQKVNGKRVEPCHAINAERKSQVYD